MGNESSRPGTSRSIPGALSANQALMHRCAQVGDINRLRGIIRQKLVKLDCADPNGNTALHKAAWHGHLLICRLLVREGASARLLNQRNQTAHSLAKQRSRTECADFLDDIMNLPAPEVVREKFRKKVRTSNCAKVFGPRQSIRGRHMLIPGVPDTQHESEQGENWQQEAVGYSDAAHWELEREEAYGPSAPASKPEIEQHLPGKEHKLHVELNANLVPDKTPRDIEVTLSEGRYFNAWKATVLYAKQCKLHQVQELRSRQLPAHAPSSSRQLRPAAARRPWPEMMLKEIGKRNGEEREKVLQYVWGSLSSAAKTAGFTPIWMRELSYFHRYATLPPSPDQDLSPRDQHAFLLAVRVCSSGCWPRLQPPPSALRPSSRPSPSPTLSQRISQHFPPRTLSSASSPPLSSLPPRPASCYYGSAPAVPRVLDTAVLLAIVNGLTEPEEPPGAPLGEREGALFEPEEDDASVPSAKYVPLPVMYGLPTDKLNSDHEILL